MNKHTIDCIILTNSADKQRYDLTCRAIETLRESEKNAPTTRVDICVVESNIEASNNGFFYNTLSTSTPLPFNYNRALNNGIAHHIKIKNKLADWILISNNDVVYTQSWLSNIIKAAEENPDVKSFSPFNPDWPIHQMMNIAPNDILRGHRVPYELIGWCILFKSELVTQLKLFDEQFQFWCQDNDYGETLRSNNIQHALVPSSVVYHDESKSHDLIEDSRKNELTYGATGIFNRKWHA